MNKKRGFEFPAAAFLIFCEVLILIALFDVAVYLLSAFLRGDSGVGLIVLERMEYIIASVSIAVGGTLLLNYICLENLNRM